VDGTRIFELGSPRSTGSARASNPDPRAAADQREHHRSDHLRLVGRGGAAALRARSEPAVAVARPVSATLPVPPSGQLWAATRHAAAQRVTVVGHERTGTDAGSCPSAARSEVASANAHPIRMTPDIRADPCSCRGPPPGHVRRSSLSDKKIHTIRWLELRAPREWERNGPLSACFPGSRHGTQSYRCVVEPVINQTEAD
jgi:hypothetical protein